MLLLNCHYQDESAASLLTQALDEIETLTSGEAAFLCIGSDRHILDCLGPLIGTMIREKAHGLRVYGTLESPLHAGNLLEKWNRIRGQHKPGSIIAVDASLGHEEELGMIRLRDEPLRPGKALLKGLPPIGDYCLTGVVSSRAETRLKSTHNGSLNAVYHIASLISQAVVLWYNQGPKRPEMYLNDDGLI
ncbi:MAG TPA: spore protease YyaC [Syntrophomonadaceae bacterium]|nr:spore protease YyaC [Syntrophomonadaceae bacterium]